MVEINTFEKGEAAKNNMDHETMKNYGIGIRHLQIVCMSVTLMTLFIGRGCISVAILAMTDKNRLNDTQVYDWDKKTQDMILSSFYWLYALMQLPASLLAKRFGGKIVILIALLSNGVLSLVFPFLAQIGGWPVVCAARVLMGVTQSCLFPTMHALIGQWLPAHEITALTGVVYGGVQIGTVISMPMSGLLAETRWGWQLIYYVVGGIMFFNAGVWHFLAASSPGTHRFLSLEEKRYIEQGSSALDKGKFRIPWKQIFLTRELWAVMVAFVAGSICTMVFLMEIPTFLERCMHFSLANSAMFSSFPFIGMWGATIISSYVGEAICNRKLVTVGTCRKIFSSITLLGSAVGLISLSFLGPNHQSIIMITLIGTLMMTGCNISGYMVNILDMSPNFAGVLLGIINTVCNIAATLTPITTSFILRNDPTDVSRWRIVFLSSSSILIVSNIIYLMFATSNRQEWDDPTSMPTKGMEPELNKWIMEKEKLISMESGTTNTTEKFNNKII